MITASSLTAELPPDAPRSPQPGNSAQNQSETEVPAAPWYTPSEEDIAIAAWHLYEQSGYEAGHELEHWLEAERQLKNPENPQDI